MNVNAFLRMIDVFAFDTTILALDHFLEHIRGVFDLIK